jgi:oligogalacturonide transport system permease protein
VLLSVPLKLLVALAFALVLNRKTRFTDLFTTVFYLPSILGASVSSPSSGASSSRPTAS